MKSIDWNQASELGLIERINKEILHPIGLAMCRVVETGVSPKILIADDGVFKYEDDYQFKPVLNRDDIQSRLSDMVEGE